MKVRISVIIPAYNEGKHLSSCLESLQHQTYPKDQFEIIVVDNGSKDNTAAVARKFTSKVFVYKDIQGCGASRQFGSTQAKGDILVFMDGDCIAKPDWLSKIDELLKDPTVVCVGGTGIPDKKTLGAWFLFGFYDWFWSLNNALRKPLMWGYNMAIKRSAYEEVGGINSSLLSSEDWEVALRLQKRFGKESIRYIKDLEVITSTRKQIKPKIFYRYAKNGIYNYVMMMLLGKVKARASFNVR